MGLPENPPQIEGMGSEAEAKKWVIAGIALRAPLRPINTNQSPSPVATAEDGGVNKECCSSPKTPTEEESRIPVRLLCPPAPRKRKQQESSHQRCHPRGGGGVVEFYNPPDLETLFIRRVRRAN